MEGTAFICGRDDGDSVVLGGLDRWIACVDRVIVWRRNLDWDLLGRNVILGGTRALVVEDVKGWCMALLFELGVYTLESGDHACVFSCFHRS